MKISRKNQPTTSSNNQLVKYTESIKKFNDLMVKFIQKEELQGEVPSDMDLETFQRLKEKLGANR
jgi:chromosome condensin MukBEF complex kleisin-like MukF subunit